MTPAIQDGALPAISLWQRRSFLVAIAGVLLAVTAALLDPVQFLRSYLYAFTYFTGLGLGCLGILLMHHTVGGKWGMVIRRFCETGARTLPYMAILLIPILVGIRVLYPWARPEAALNANIQSKSAYLNIPFFIIRSCAYFAIWTLYARLLTKRSGEQDRTGDPRLIEKMRAISAPGLLVFTFSGTFAFVDWIMSLEPTWFSTMYGAMFLVGEVLEAFAFVIVVLILLSKWEPLRARVSAQHLHDLGNMMFAFTVLWAYLAFSQFLIIWAGNLPDETPWYLRRLRGGWGAIAVFLVVFHFCVPFLLLLRRETKRRASLLIKVSCLLLAVRMVDVYWVVEPGFYGNSIQVHWTDLVTPLAVGGIWLSLFLWELRGWPLLPLRDPRLEGNPRETVAF